MEDEENAFVGGHEVATLMVALVGSSARVIERENLGRNKGGIQPVGHQKAADRRDNEPRRVQRFAAIGCNLAKRSRAKQGDREPDDDAEQGLHFGGFVVMLDLMN